jgi:methyl-accepting chemotaxis protein
MSWKNMTLGKKIGLGFALLILITVVLGGLGAWWMKGSQGDSEMLAQEYVPEMAIAAEIRGAANRLMYQMRGYGFTEDKQYYENAQTELKALQAGIEKGNELTKRAVHLKKLGPQLKAIETAEDKYRQSMEETLNTTDHLAEQRKQLDENAAKYMQNSNDFLAAQNAAFDKDLDEREKKIDIITDVVERSTHARVENFKAQSANDMVLMQQAAAHIREVEKELELLRPLTADAEDLKRIEGIETAAEKYAKNMEAYIATSSMMEKAGADMDKNAALYLKNCNDFLASQNVAMQNEFNETGSNLPERLHKIHMINNTIDLGNEARVMNFKGQATQDVKLMQGAMDKFKGAKTITSDLRKITRRSANIEQIKTIESAADGYLAAMEAYLKNYQELDTHRNEMDASAENYVKNCETFLEGQQKKLGVDMHERKNKITFMNEIVDLGNDMRIKAFKSQALRDPVFMEQGQENFKKIDEKFAEIRKITRVDADLARLDQIQKAAAGYHESMGKFLEGWHELQEIGKTRESVGEDIIQGTKVLQDAAASATGEVSIVAASNLSTASTTMIIGLILAFVVGTLLAIFLARGIIIVLKRISAHMDEGAEQVASASGQVSSSSQSLAEGASEQAASIEETSSSLEEMSSMTKRNAENAGQADRLMREANQIVSQANDSMTELTGSMQEITKASEETSKIIKTIDEIAFQTNLLALNAAVEAARAGEAGAGFAVVADEVRNLAMRAAEAAKNTANLIEGTVKKVNDGSELVVRTNDAFGKVAESAQKVGQLVGDIAAASNEQAQGIDQVNTAVADMDKVTQQNAANAEESASAAEEMNAQAEQMRASVAELMKLVGGFGNGNNRGSAAITLARAKMAPVHHALAAPRRKAARKEVHPEEIIPLDDNGFKDF